jgi:hypothetical protein
MQAFGVPPIRRSILETALRSFKRRGQRPAPSATRAERDSGDRFAVVQTAGSETRAERVSVTRAERETSVNQEILDSLGPLPTRRGCSPGGQFRACR